MQVGIQGNNSTQIHSLDDEKNYTLIVKYFLTLILVNFSEFDFDRNNIYNV